MVEFRFKISDEAFNLLLIISKEGYVEYRDTEYETIEEFEKSGNVSMNLNSFKSRNCNGTLYLIPELYKYNFICDVEDAWHISYRISDLGKSLLDNLIRKLKLEKIESNDL
jgi:hypothetical protein